MSHFFVRESFAFLLDSTFKMGIFGKQRYFGLRGLKLNIAVGVIAGLDFLLFGYDQGVVVRIDSLDLFTPTPSFPHPNSPGFTN